ncbi:MAG: thiopurine S-methyltransferase [Aggregatilineales bacterium]
MDENFWHKRWAENSISFHEAKANPLLVTYFQELNLEKDSRVFIPLCGKTLAIAWFLSQGYQVVGAELSELAIQQLFTELGVEPQITQIGDLKHYSAPDVDIFVGDIFNLTRQTLGTVDAIFDRAALVALPAKMRDQYTLHITAITDSAPQLLITFEYDQTRMDGPPFSVSGEEVNNHYHDTYDITPLASIEVAGMLKGKVPAKESVWHLKSRTQNSENA